MPSLAPALVYYVDFTEIIFILIKRLKLIGSWFLERSAKLITTSKNIFSEIHMSRSLSVPLFSLN